MKRDHETSGSGADSKHGARSGAKPASSAPSRVRSVLHLQRTAGNRAVSSRLATNGTPIPIQRDSKDLVEGLEAEDIGEVVDSLRDVIGNSGSPTALALHLAGKESINKIASDEQSDEANEPEGGKQAESKPSVGRSTTVNAATVANAKQKALGGEVKLTELEANTALQSRYNTIAGLRSSRQKLFGTPFSARQVEDLSDLSKTSDEDFTTIAGRYKALGPLVPKLKKAYGNDLNLKGFKVGDSKMKLEQLLNPATSDEDFTQFQSDLTTKAKSAADLEEIKKLEGELERSDLHLHPKSPAQLQAMSTQRQAIYLKYLKKKADEVNADEEDTFAQQEFNKQLLKGGAKTKEQRAAERAAKKK